MVINLAVYRIKGESLVNNIIFEYKLRNSKIKKLMKTGYFTSVDTKRIIQQSCYGGVYSYEMTNHALTSGEFVNGLLFGLLPIFQGFDINNAKMMSTYLKDKISI